MARCTCAGSRAHAGPACPESATASTRRAASRRRPTTRRAGRSPRGGGSRCPSLRRPRRRGDEVGRQCGPSCASLPRRKGSTRSAKGEVEDRRRATGDVIDKVQQSKSNPRRTPMTLLSCSPRTTTRRGAVGESDGKSDDADSAASLNAACRLGERCFYGPPASELAGTRPRPSVPIRPKNHHVAPTPCHAAFRLSGAPAGGLEAGNPVLDVAPTGGSAAARIEGGEPACRVPACSPISNAHRTGDHVSG